MRWEIKVSEAIVLAVNVDTCAIDIKRKSNRNRVQ